MFLLFCEFVREVKLFWKQSSSVIAEDNLYTFLRWSLAAVRHEKQLRQEVVRLSKSPQKVREAA